MKYENSETLPAYVIRIEGLARSEEAAARCIESAVKYDMNVETFDASTPETLGADSTGQLDMEKGDFSQSVEYSQDGRVQACFLSHFLLWRISMDSGVPVMILEHDAVFHAPIPQGRYKVCSFGKPSFGMFTKAHSDGFHPAFSKGGGSYLGGAHAYVVTPKGAKALVKEAREKGFCATDLYLSRLRFPWLKEYFPWPVHVEETFSTVQQRRGCVAKHGYSDTYEVL